MVIPDKLKKEVTMKKLHLAGILALAILLVVVVCGCSGPVQVPELQSQRAQNLIYAAEEAERLGVIWSQQDVGLWVNGEGKATAVPDIAILQLGVETQQESLLEAQREAAEAMDKVIKELKSSGIAEKDIQTQRYNIYPVRRWVENENREELIGYRVNNIVIAKIRKIDEAGKVIDAVAKSAGDTTRIDGINFSVDDPTSYYDEARKKAVNDAQRKAEQIADEAGIKLGKPIYITEGMVYTPSVRDVLYKAEGAVPSEVTTPITAGELEYQVTVQIVYEID
jgi:uncharacterized protein YggE